MNIERLPRTVEMKQGENSYQFVMVDQTKLPYELTYITTTDWHEVVHAITTLAVRGLQRLVLRVLQHWHYGFLST